jgi:osmotically-inducible protein OsmY
MRNGNPALLASILLCSGTLALQGCLSSPQCTSQECRNDAKITADIQAKLKEHRELGGPNSVYVQTRGGVVYLTGQVATDLQRQTAESVVREVPGVGEVVNSIAISFEGR